MPAVLFALIATAVTFQSPNQRSPTRDARPPAQTGAAIVRGRVVAADTGRPLRRARITLSGAELGREGRSTSTGLDGRYEISELPAGRYTIRVTRSGYLPLQFGQRRPLEPGKPIQLRDKETLDRVDFSLPRASVISGQISDELSEPVADVQVLAMRSTVAVGQFAGDNNFALMPWYDAEYLDTLRRHGQRLALTEAGSRALSLKLVTP